MSLTVIDAAARHRYEAQLEGETAGYLMYQRASGQIVLVHTVVDPRFEGHGVGSALVREAMEDARRQGSTVRVVCPFAAGWLPRHPEYQDLISDT